MVNEEKPKRKGRGPGKKPALICTSLRLPREVIEYFNTFHPADKQAKIREVLTNYVINQGVTQNGTQESN